jgi:hypothetical protein
VDGEREVVVTYAKQLSVVDTEMLHNQASELFPDGTETRVVPSLKNGPLCPEVHINLNICLLH